ncbi:hypothetical protein [Giesbergeria anulus]|uniref:hypothetical protein n=1 Tax=Giesbergeria anulus TaxID=180197 RepID=UPI000B8812E1|nr:hypothetical protein [Giesbergeria anulus]
MNDPTATSELNQAATDMEELQAVADLALSVQSASNPVVAAALAVDTTQSTTVTCRDLHLKSVRPAFSAFLGQH